ncbi:10985_t:CDS:2 [Diversispora eburnea]|uniref:Methylated-DNA--protein-cysteine methyltransferase n=1 Tax=Diversispora eburnea TaxID=1213867 RepID=A0A9N9FTP7_9GLOM|nr:10985_t:CDS:2 [Diversispora eburnea]
MLNECRKINGLSEIYYPKTKKERENFINSKSGKLITKFQYKVYDLCSQIPEGYISTYKLLANALKSSPRAVGGSLRVNPFSPFIPCHRVIASNFFIGGFDGEWIVHQSHQSLLNNKKHEEIFNSNKISRKRELLEKEGIFFDNNGWLIDWQNSKRLFTDFHL